MKIKLSKKKWLLIGTICLAAGLVAETTAAAATTNSTTRRDSKVGIDSKGDCFW
jgi:hypothetical protein